VTAITTDDWAYSTITVLDADGPTAGVDLMHLKDLPTPPSFLNRGTVQKLVGTTGMHSPLAIEPGWEGLSALPLMGTPAIPLALSPEDCRIVQQAYDA
jgi:hypothetical protein